MSYRNLRDNTDDVSPLIYALIFKDAVKLDTVKLDTVKLDTVKLDAVKLDTVKLDTVKLDIENNTNNINS